MKYKYDGYHAWHITDRDIMYKLVAQSLFGKTVYMAYDSTTNKKIGYFKTDHDFEEYIVFKEYTKLIKLILK